MFEQAFRKYVRHGRCYNPQLKQLIPEASAVGESQSNSKAESSVLRLEDLIRTYKPALECHIEFRIPNKHAGMIWIVDHAASMYNKTVCNDDGSAPYEVVQGQRSRGKLAEFGERIFYDLPKRLRAKLDLRFKLGVLPGNPQNSNEASICIGNGNVVKSRSVVRVVASQMWSKDAISKTMGATTLRKLSIHMPTKIRP